MIHPDLLVLIVGVFVTFMAVWAFAVYVLLLVQRRRRETAADSEVLYLAEERAGGVGI